MSRHGQVPVIPRNGHTLVVGIVARISGCQNQKELSLEDQADHAKQVIDDLYQGPVDYRTIATKGKGERLDRPELAEVETMLRSKELDFLVAEDIGRMVRGTEAATLCGIAVDHGTRVIAPNDCIDTSEDSWEEDVISACRDHVGHNAHTSKRLKQKLMNRFVKFGGATAREIFGYIKPPGARTYEDIQKDPAAIPIYAEWFRILGETANCAAVADFLNARGVPTGKYIRRKAWDGTMVRRITRNPILKGLPGRGFKRTIKHNESGRRVAVKNPSGPQYRECPHLAFVTPEEWEKINDKLDKRNAHFRRITVNGSDPLKGVPRKRTRFPGQHARCWYCGRQYVWGGHGQTDSLMCNGCREWHCWNSVSFSGPMAVERLVAAITRELYSLDGFDNQFRGLVMEAQNEGGVEVTLRREKATRDREQLTREKENLLAAIASYGPRPMFEQKLTEIDSDDRTLAREIWELESIRKRKLELPDSIPELRGMLESKFLDLARNSHEFGQLMRQIVPDFCVYLVRLCDGGRLFPRARIKLHLGGIVPDLKHVPGMGDLLHRDLTIDLFDPPQRERIREEAVRLAAQGLKQKVIALQIREKPTQPAVQNALKLDRRMQQGNLVSPYVPVTEPPSDYKKLKLIRHARYRFTPLEGHPKSL